MQKPTELQVLEAQIILDTHFYYTDLIAKAAALPLGSDDYQTAIEVADAWRTHITEMEAKAMDLRGDILAGVFNAALKPNTTPDGWDKVTS